MDGRNQPNYLARAKSFIAGGIALLSFVAALAAGTAGAPAFGGLSWVMVTAGAIGVVYVTGAVLVAALVEMRTHTAPLHPVVVSSRGGKPRSSGR